MTAAELAKRLDKIADKIKSRHTCELYIRNSTAEEDIRLAAEIIRTIARMEGETEDGNNSD